MRERPILFRGAMVRAILSGAKTQTRRVVKPGKDRELGCPLAPCELAGEINAGSYSNSVYGAPGDHLWVRETHLNWWKINPINPTGPRIFSHCAAYAADGYQLEAGEKWTPSIHMLRAASRITLKITGVRIERLHAITEDGARAEGCAPAWLDAHDDTTVHAEAKPTYRQGFARLWRDINGAESWGANPWVWVVEFRRIEA